ncbi:MAG TPA: hypothetical protein VG604_00510 [Candidatus Saccharimonadales bacterium]|nr:hypothetical protein [Candidatus Saccharimonadales bacterium]
MVDFEKDIDRSEYLAMFPIVPVDGLPSAPANFTEAANTNEMAPTVTARAYDADRMVPTVDLVLPGHVNQTQAFHEALGIASGLRRFGRAAYVLAGEMILGVPRQPGAGTSQAFANRPDMPVVKAGAWSRPEVRRLIDPQPHPTHDSTMENLRG